VLAFLAWRGSVLKEHPDVVRLSRYVLSGYGPQGHAGGARAVERPGTYEPVRADAPDGDAWGIVQNDGLSNAKVARWDPTAKPADILPVSLHHTVPFLMGHPPMRILVLFAGVGLDLVELDGMAQGRANSAWS
jgi:hypothetical protein